MKDLLRPFKQFYETNEEFKRRMDSFVRVRKTEDWEFFVALLRVVQGVMANQMMSAGYSNMKADEKDVGQSLSPGIGSSTRRHARRV